ncbi:MAG TPA: GNAT family protein [Actinomycetota bacterium]
MVNGNADLSRISAVWPLYGLRIRTPVLELRLPTLDDLAALATLGAQGIFAEGDPYVSPVAGWTEQPSPGLERALVQYHWRTLAEWDPWRWEFAPVVLHDGRIVGTQDAGAEDFPVVRSVSTTSWLGLAFQGRGLGREMQDAILHLAFAGLGARVAYTSAWEENVAALRMARALGYQPNGTELRARGNEAAVQVNLVLERSDWERRRREDIEITGLEACAELFTGLEQ